MFRSRRSDRVKCLMYDGTGLILISKRLERGGFQWPPVSDGIVRLAPVLLSVLLSGLPWNRLRVREIDRPKAAC